MHRIKVQAIPNRVIVAYVYYSNGTTMIERVVLPLEETPENSGLYVSTQDDAIEIGDTIIIHDETASEYSIIGGGAYYENDFETIQSIREQTDKLRFTEDSEPAILAQIDIPSTAIQQTLTIKDTSDTPIGNASVWLTLDELGNDIVKSGCTDAHGQITFYLTPGDYYLYARKSGYNFDIPKLVTVGNE